MKSFTLRTSWYAGLSDPRPLRQSPLAQAPSCREVGGSRNAHRTKAGATSRSAFASASSHLDSRVYDLQLGKLGETFLGELHAHTRLLGAAEGDVRGDVEMLVDLDGDGFDLACDFVSTLRIRRPNGGAEAIICRIGAADGVVLIGEFNERQNRTKLLLIVSRRGVLLLSDQCVL